MGLTKDEPVSTIKRKDLQDLCLCLLYKRTVDGLNGRTWNAQQHLIWERRVNINLKRHNCLGNKSDIEKGQASEPE